MITLYNTVSLDGYITDKNGSEDFIPYEAWHDFIELCSNFDVVVMGKNSYQAIQCYKPKERKLFEELAIKKVVISRDKNFYPNSDYFVVRSIKELLKLGNNILLTGGPSLNDVFLKEQLIDKIIVNIVPVKVAGGFKKFKQRQPKIVRNSEKKIAGGRILRTYNIVK